MAFPWRLSDSKSPQVSRIFLSILADLNYVVVWMVSTRALISKSPSPCTNLLVTVPRVPITIGINVTFMFNNFLNSLARSRFLSFFLLSFNFAVVSRNGKIHNSTSSLFLSFFFFLIIIITRSGRLVKMRWSVYISKSHRSLCVLFNCIDSGLCTYLLFVWSNFNFLHSPQFMTLFTQSCLVLYSFCANYYY